MGVCGPYMNTKTDAFDRYICAAAFRLLALARLTWLRIICLMYIYVLLNMTIIKNMVDELDFSG